MGKKEIEHLLSMPPPKTSRAAKRHGKRASSSATTGASKIEKKRPQKKLKKKKDNYLDQARKEIKWNDYTKYNVKMMKLKKCKKASAKLQGVMAKLLNGNVEPKAGEDENEEFFDDFDY